MYVVIEASRDEAHEYKIKPRIFVAASAALILRSDPPQSAIDHQRLKAVSRPRTRPQPMTRVDGGARSHGSRIQRPDWTPYLKVSVSFDQFAKSPDDLSTSSKKSDRIYMYVS